VTGLLDRFRDGDRQALARLLSHIENRSDLGTDALRALASYAGDSHVIGLTGPPGAGKSTLANEIIKAVRRRKKSIAVLAVDPSSPLTGGATLGDRIRMLESQNDPGVFLRSMASRGQMGGLTLAAFGALIALDSFGFDFVLIETVGAGQDEVDIARVADTVIVVQTPGMGDSIQAVKAGILEIADILVVNKADLPGADEVIRDLREQVRGGKTSGWRIPVLPVAAVDGAGVDQLLDELESHRKVASSTDSLTRKRLERLREHARMIAISEFSRFLDSVSMDNATGDPATLADTMIASFVSSHARTSE
jgi:LAO/AO transport system kinase